jgi:hypothetical protein
MHGEYNVKIAFKFSISFFLSDKALVGLRRWARKCCRKVRQIRTNFIKPMMSFMLAHPSCLDTVKPRSFQVLYLNTTLIKLVLSNSVLGT